MKVAIGAVLLTGVGVISTVQAQTPAAAPAAAPVAAPAPHVYGRVEHARVVSSPNPIEVDAKMDGDGANTVLHALNIKYANGPNGMMVNFTLDNGHVVPGKEVNLALPLLKDEHIKDKYGSIEHHPLVAMQFCIGDHAIATDVVLEPVTTFTPPLELSKAEAARFGQLDTAKKFTIDASCAPAAPAAPAATPAKS
jgi:hypothetical protein